MKKQLTLWALAALFFASASPVSAQNDRKIAISVIDFFLPTVAAIDEKKKEKSLENPYHTSNQPAKDIRTRMEKLQGFVASVFGSDARFVLIDRSSLGIVQKEQELQKTEQFLDGYVVGQGKKIGADYLLSGDFDLNSITLTVSLFSVAEQTIVSKEVIEMKKAYFNFAANFRDPVVDGTRRLAARVFPMMMSVVEITEQKKDKAKAILVAGGNNRGVKRGQSLDIKLKEEREVDGQMQTYYRTVGQGSVDKVEDDNFSIVEVTDGEEEVKKLIDSGKKLYCTFKL